MKPKHLLTIQDLSSETIKELLALAQELIDKGHHRFGAEPVLAKKTLINLFFESSTRTRVSFELAAKRLGADVVNIDVHRSSIEKGESLLDTLYTFSSMYCDFLVIRHPENNIPAFLAEHVSPEVSVINAGDGCHAHPSQALLDMLTIQQYQRDFSRLTVAIIGDIAHSRVARSQIVALQKLHVGELRLIGPESWLPDNLPGKHYQDLDAGLSGADVIMLLRIQRERMTASDIPDHNAYFAEYGLTRSRLRLAKPDAIVMHPGPINRGVEIAGDVADSPQSVIYQQVSNGIAMRMALLKYL